MLGRLRKTMDKTMAVVREPGTRVPRPIGGGSVSIGVILRLSVPEFTIFSGGVHKFIVTALLDDSAFVENDYLIAEPAA